MAKTAPKGFIHLTVKRQTLSISTVAISHIVAVLGLWDDEQDMCTGCNVMLSNGGMLNVEEMPQDIDERIADALSDEA